MADMSCSKDDTSCTKDDTSCTKDDASCSKDDTSCSKDDTSCSKDDTSRSKDLFFYDSSGWKEESQNSSKSRYPCYQLPQNKNALLGDNKCYELPDSYTKVSSHSPSDKKLNLSKDSSPCLQRSDCSSLVLHQKKLGDLKSSESKEIEIVSTGEWKYSDSESTIPIKKRKRSEDKDERFTPKRSRESKFSPLESPSYSRKSLPSTSYHSHFSDRRRSLPSSTPTRTKYNRTDQTPYASPLHRRPGIRKYLPYYDASSLLHMESESGFVDSHCHLDFLVDRQRYSGTWAQYKEENEFPRCYKGCLAVFCNPHTFSRRYKWAPFLEVDGVWASFGCHPHNASDYNDHVEGYLLQALEHPKVRALGEIGLDYSSRNGCKKEQQFSAFKRQLKIALKRQLPVVIHCREAHEDGLRVVKEILPSDYTIHLHCFTDSWEWAEEWLAAFPNLFIGITNVVTFPSASSVHEVVAHIPLNRLLLETDAPYFVPKSEKTRAKHSHPGMAIHVAAQIAAIRNTPLEEVLRHTRNNTKRVYNI